ncbi:MAG: hypothetical protein HKM07_06960 [Chlamydiae bacterium]|nr:hypothetical protein [Chlamydiota bacterium]
MDFIDKQVSKSEKPLKRTKKWLVRLLVWSVWLALVIYIKAFEELGEGISSFLTSFKEVQSTSPLKLLVAAFVPLLIFFGSQTSPSKIIKNPWISLLICLGFSRLFFKNDPLSVRMLFTICMSVGFLTVMLFVVQSFTGVKYSPPENSEIEDIEIK